MKTLKLNLSLWKFAFTKRSKNAQSASKQDNIKRAKKPSFSLPHIPDFSGLDEIIKDLENGK